MRRRRLTLLCALLLLITGTGCVDGTVRLSVLPDGSGSVSVDLGYDTRKWPGIFGDPLAGYRSPGQLRRLTDPGFVAWSEPRVVEEGNARRWQSEVFFDQLSRVRVMGTSAGEVFEALGFNPDLSRGRIELRAGFAQFLDAPLPLPTPGKVGLSEVSLSPELLEAIRQRIRPVILGLDVTFEVEMPGVVTRADGCDGFEGRTARIRIGEDRLARAFEQRAGVLVDEESVREAPVLWSFAVPANWDPDQAESMARRKADALRWWNGR